MASNEEETPKLKNMEIGVPLSRQDDREKGFICCPVHKGEKEMRRKNLTAMAMAAMMIMSNVTPSMMAMAGPNTPVEQGDTDGTSGGTTGSTDDTTGGNTDGTGDTDGTIDTTGDTTTYGTLDDTVKADGHETVQKEYNVEVDDTVTYTKPGSTEPYEGTTYTDGTPTGAYDKHTETKNAAEASNQAVLIINGDTEAKGEGNAVDADTESSVTVNGANGATANEGNAVDANNATVKITNGSATSTSGYAVNATNGATVDVKENATSGNDTVVFNDNSNVQIGGDVENVAKENDQDYDSNLNSTVYTNHGTTEIDGNVYGGTSGASIYASDESTVKVAGKVENKKTVETSDGDEQKEVKGLEGVYSDHSNVSVADSVTSAGTAVTATGDSNVTIGTKSEENTDTDGGADEPGDLIKAVDDEEKDPIIAVKSTDGKGVVVNDNSTATVYGDIEAKDDALTVTGGNSAGDSTAATVDGDVTSSDGKGVTATGTVYDETNVDITGSVTSKDDAVTAHEANVTIGTLPEETAGTDAEVSVEDPVITSSNGKGISADYLSNVTANGSVDANGNAVEASVWSNVQVNGNAKSAEGNGIVSNDSTVTVTGDVDAEKGTGIEAKYSTVTVTGDVDAADGITANESTVTIKGTVTTSTGEAITIASSGKTTVLVEGDVKLSKEEGEPSTDVVADKKQLTIDLAGGTQQNENSEVAVAGQLGGDGDDVVLKVNVGTVTTTIGDQKIDEGQEVLIVPEIVVGSVDLDSVTVTDQDGVALSNELQAAVKDNIKYIVSSDLVTVDEQGNQKITETGAMTITTKGTEDGLLAKDKSGNYDVALANEELTINVEVATGYKLSKFNLNGADVDLDNNSYLVKNENGSYTLLVPANGSGVDLKAVIEAIEEEKKDETTPDDKKDDTSADDKKDDATTDDKKDNTATDDKKDNTTPDSKKDNTTTEDKKNETTKTEGTIKKTETNTNVTVISHKSSGSGGGSSSSSYSAVSTSAAATTGTAVAGPGSSMSQWGFDGTNWSYKKDDGTVVKSQWMYLTYNGHSDWYYFDANGVMKTGWFQDADGNTYYLNPVSDGLKGAMKKGSVEIDGQVYLFSDAGALVK